MQTSGVDTTPKLFYLDLEVDHVPEDDKDTARCITQICICDAERDAFLSFDIKPPKGLKRKSEKLTLADIQKPRVSWKKAWPFIKEFVNRDMDGNRFAVLVAHNGYKHDWPIIENECARINEAIPKYWKPFDTLYLATALGVPEGERSLDGLCKRHRVSVTDRHTAEGDVKLLRSVFKNMFEGSQKVEVLNAMTLPKEEGPVKEVAKRVSEAVLVFFDFETTGLFPKNGEEGEPPRVTEIGAYIPSKNATFSQLVDPGLDDGFVLSDKVIEITHITPEMIREESKKFQAKYGRKMTFEAVWRDFESWIKQEIGSEINKVVVLAGHNIWNYDIPVYKVECERFGMEVKWIRSIDTCVLSRKANKGHKPQPKGFHKLVKLANRMGIPFENAHRAHADAIVNSKVFDVFVQGVPKDELNSALLSGHPANFLEQRIIDFGTFKPGNYMVQPEQKIENYLETTQDKKMEELVRTVKPQPPQRLKRQDPETAAVSVSDQPKETQSSKKQKKEGDSIKIIPTLVTKELQDTTEFTISFSIPKTGIKEPSVIPMAADQEDDSSGSDTVEMIQSEKQNFIINFRK